MDHLAMQPIAIVGVAADLPSGTYSDANFNHAQFFEFLLDAGEAYENIPASRFNIDAWKGKGLGQIAVEKGSFLKDIDLFDHIEFGISSRDARAMAPATRILLEQSFLALLDSGIDYRKQPIGCYMTGTSIELLNVSNPDEYEPRGSFAAAPGMIANRVSTHLDLLGPSIPVDTACSSSMMALHLAVQAILLGDCKAAVVGGCQLNHRLIDWIGYSQSAVLSSDGKCKPFDASADGFGRAEGCVAIVIKPLQDALRDHDHIYATILGTAVNSTGSAGPPGAPVAEPQAKAMTLAFERAGRNPTDVAYIELHATGTAKGDPTEVNWIGQHFQRPEELLIGSVKGNIGHTEITAFLASLSKVLSIFEHKVIPPNVNLSTPNPAIKWGEYNLRVPTQPTPLPSAESGNTLISMASSGIGGSNGHVVLEAPPLVHQESSEHRINGSVLLMAAGLSPRSVSAIADQISAVFKIAPASEHPAASTVLGRRSKQMNWRSYAVTTPGLPIQFSSPEYSGRDVNSLVFVFSGQGPQHENMGRDLFNSFPAFRNSILDMDDVFRRKTNKSMIDDYGLFASVPSAFPFTDVWPISLTLPAIAMFQIALFDLLVSLGIVPDTILGHSAGETAVLYASGAASKSMAVELAIIRGQVFSTLETSGGTMAALSCTAEAAEELLTQHASTSTDSIVEVACLNSPSAVAISGREQSIDGVLDLAQRAGIFGRKIRTRVPIHSSMMDACRDQYRKEVQDLFDRYPGDHVPKISTYSTLTGHVFLGPFDAEYFWLNTRAQVLFEPAVRNLSGISTFVEIAPHPVLSSYISDMSTGSSAVLSSVRRPKTGMASTEHRDMLLFLGKLTATGHNCVDFTLLNAAACSESKLRLPPYPFLKKQFPLFPDTRNTDHYYGPVNHSRLKLNRDTHPTFSEHVIRGEPIWPAAGFLEMGLEFGATALFNVNFRAMLPLSAESPVPVDVTLDGSHWKVASIIPEARIGQKSIERVHADGYITFEVPPDFADLDISEMRGRCNSHVDSDFYPSLSYFSAYGSKFQRVTNLYYNVNEALASIRGIDGSLVREDSYILHPAVLDACFQIAAYRPFNGDFAPNNYYLPSSIGELILHQPPKAKYFPPHVYAHVQLSSWMPESLRFDVTVINDFGKCLCTLRNVEVAKHQISPSRGVSSPLHLATQPVFPEKRTVSEPLDDSDLVRWSNRDFIADTENIEIETAMTSNLRLRDTISSLTANDRQQVIRICICSDMAWFILGVIKEILNEIRNAAFELSIPESCILPDEIDQPFTVVRREKSLSDKGMFFDIVVLFGRTSSNAELDPHSLITNCDDILLPGGTLVLSSFDCNGSACSVPVNGASDSIGDKPSTLDTAEYVMVLHQMGYSILHTSHSPAPFGFTIDAQKATWKPDLTVKSELLDEDAFVFNYTFGGEDQLQWDFSGLNPSQELEIWILAVDGRDTAAGLGLARALRREYLFWTIRFVSFPATFSQEMQMDALWSLPSCMREEKDIIFSQTGDPLVPRLAPLYAPAPSQLQTRLRSSICNLDPDYAIAHIQHTSRFPYFSAFVGSVIQVNPDFEDFHPGSLVVGLQDQASVGRSTICLESTCVVPMDMSFDKLVDHIPGVIISVLGPGINTYNRSRRIHALSVLVTHCDTLIGSTVCEMYTRDGLKFSRARQDISILDLARMGNERFDLIISGYEDAMHSQVLRTLLRPSKGKLFLWHHELPIILRDDPLSIGIALRAAGSIQFLRPRDGPWPRITLDADMDHLGDSTGAVFDAKKTYVILGGIGSLGASIAVFLFQRGARHIIVTSRTGRAKPKASKENSLIVQRIFGYLQSLDCLDIRFEAVDATCPVSMGVLFHSIGQEIGGCFILTAVLADGLFPTLGEEEFRAVYSSKMGVFETLQQTIDISTMEFLVAFSSVTSLVGTGGQANYCAANAALEEQILPLPNGFSFVCPAIIDSVLMDADGSHLQHLTEWSISTDEMLLWLDDALKKYQDGARFHRYVPNLDWEAMHRTHGMVRLGAHLLKDLAPGGTAETQAASEPVVIKASRIIRNLLNISEDDFNVSVPLTSYGVDSLSAARLSFALRSVVEVTQLQLLADNSLADIISKFSEIPQDSGMIKRTEVPGTRSTGDSAFMDELVQKFTNSISHLPKNPLLDLQKTQAHTVLLTGSTGTLGCHLLAHLLARDDVWHVYALNRGSDGHVLEERQTVALQAQGLSPALAHSEKLTLLVGDLGAAELGISSEKFHELHSSVTHIIHNAWKVDFMAPISEFEPLLSGTSRLLQFAITSPCSAPPSFSFISTIGVYQNLSPSIPSAPESPITDAAVAAHTGYVESKWVGERLVQLASETRCLNANVIRVGLLTGSANGSWDVSQWVPALVQSGVHVGCLPDGNDIISWIPIGTAAAAIVDMQGTMNETLHLIHPRPTTWNTIMEPLASLLEVPLVPYAEWFARLKSTAEFAHQEPGVKMEGGGATALKLLDYFQFGLKPAPNAESMGLLPRAASQKGFHASKTLMDEGASPIDSTDVEKWVKYWRGVGFLPCAH